MRTWPAAVLLAFLLACSSAPIYERGPFPTLLLTAVPGHEGKLVNQTCLKRDAREECERWDMKEWDLRDTLERERLRQARLVCEVAGKYFSACVERPGLCHQTHVETKWLLGIKWLPLKRELRAIDYIDAEADYRRLLDGNTRCEVQPE